MKHCRWLGIPIRHDEKIHPLLMGSTNFITDWEKSFTGAFVIVLYFSAKDKKEWVHVAVLVHEIGHVIDFRENTMPREKVSVIKTERTANRYGNKVLSLLDIPKNKVKKHLDRIVRERQMRGAR